MTASGLRAHWPTLLAGYGREFTREFSIEELEI
jgi:hypothetical protein